MKNRLKTNYRRYYGHKMRAKYSNIEFLFEFDDWVAWWENHLGPDWASKRGHHRGQYVMARNGDKGPYHPNNVHLATAEENCSERKINGATGSSDHNGELNPKCKLTKEKVLEIFKAEGTYKEIAALYDISLVTVRDIKKQRSWKQLTNGLTAVKGTHRAALDLKIKQIINDYKSGLSIKECGARYNCTGGNIGAILKKYAPQVIRSRKEIPRKRDETGKFS